MAQPTPPFALAGDEAATMSAQGIAARAIRNRPPHRAPPGDITPPVPVRFPGRAGRRDRGVQRWAKAPVGLLMAVKAVEPAGGSGAAL